MMKEEKRKRDGDHLEWQVESSGLDPSQLS
jgi:hypothetical protein